MLNWLAYYKVINTVSNVGIANRKTFYNLNDVSSLDMVILPNIASTNINVLNVCNNKTTDSKMVDILSLLINGNVKNDLRLLSKVSNFRYNNASNFKVYLLNMHNTLNNIRFTKIDCVSLLDFFECVITQRPQFIQNWTITMFTVFTDFICSTLSRICSYVMCVFLCVFFLGLNLKFFLFVFFFFNLGVFSIFMCVYFQ